MSYEAPASPPEERTAEPLEVEGSEEPEGPAAPAAARPFVERLGMAAVALAIAALFGLMAGASWIGGEPFLAVMAGLGAVMTIWAGFTTVRRA